MTAGDVSAVGSAARAWQSEHYFCKPFSVAELARSQDYFDEVLNV